MLTAHFSGARDFASGSSGSDKTKLFMALMGAPGVGKGTFANKLGPHFGIPNISTGDLIREEIKRGSELGKRLKAITDRGELVGDDIMSEMLRARLAKPDCGKGFLLDGYPRRVSQAESLERIQPLDLVLNITLREDVLVEKISSRRVCNQCGANYNIANIQQGEINMPPLLPKVAGVCDKCGGKELVQRSDDTVATVRERLGVYKAQTLPLIQFYGQRNLLLNFDVKKGISDLPDILKLLSGYLQGKGKQIKPAQSQPQQRR